MNARVLELLKSPKKILSEDLVLLKEEINSFPYIQNIRALHLYGVHLYDKDKYQGELSTTAAYTTDKKILYQLINGEVKARQVPPVIQEKSSIIEQETKNDQITRSFPIKRDDEYLLDLQSEPKYVFINGERNRILFEGEESFLTDENAEVIDIESTLESGSLITQKIDEKSLEAVTDSMTTPVEEKEYEVNIHDDREEISSTLNSDEKEEVTPFQITFNEEENKDGDEFVAGQDEESKIELNTSFSSEKLINEEKIASEKSIIQEDSELSFHGMESFMPDVKIQSNNNFSQETAETSLPNFNKHEEEMRRLIEEVEKKMQEGKSVTSKVELDHKNDEGNHGISFSETQAFNVDSSPAQKGDDISKVEYVSNEIISNIQTDELPEKGPNKEEEKDAYNEGDIKQSAWKPMNVESHIPDSMITTTSEEKVTTIEHEEVLKKEKIEPQVDLVEEKPNTLLENNKENQGTIEIEDVHKEAPAMNVSFFSSNISALTIDGKKDEPKEVSETVGNQEVEPLDPNISNVPGFINTWQSWLKIDRVGDIEKSKVENKSKVIDTFIENNPKISQLRDESSYVIKEKANDISHLMTETLASLYIEQKLYTKAIKAFEILISKNPDKKEYFEGKIQEVKDIKNRN
ncbi:hypothetical protein D1632_01315 [Chryseobacterium nematophagum]|uniref:Tetratricopeptide repeat protein n=1 Tax=Chryseobacterium nematophagum TaxID=2305228 RepID=A0A3M7LGI4_9FLAO|nr:hypothetical protein [Chryseobacterium nematophagum]RMZ60652.1 hypothetical protein D1632_01315 [Chryseobacterium nematophagum]